MSVIVYEGDFVKDPMDDNRIRQVGYIVDNCMYMVDGGVMGLDEVKEVILESEMFG